MSTRNDEAPRPAAGGLATGKAMAGRGRAPTQEQDSVSRPGNGTNAQEDVAPPPGTDGTHPAAPASPAAAPPGPAPEARATRQRQIIRPLAPAGPQPPDGAANAPDDRRRRVIRRLADTPPSSPPADAPEARQRKVIRRLAPGDAEAPAPRVIRRLAREPGRDPGRPAGSVIRPLAPLPPNMPGSRDRQTGLVRPLLPLPPLPGDSPAERQERRGRRDARLAAILRPLEAAPAPSPAEIRPVDPLLRTLPLQELVEAPVDLVYCRRCETANRAAVMFCGACGTPLPAAARLYDTLTREYEDMQSAERPKAEIVPVLADGRRGPNWQAYGLSDRGLVRKNNEDTLLADPLPGGGWLLLVADGMGGAMGGEVASQHAAAIVRELIENRMALDPDPTTDHRPWLMQAIEQANLMLHRQADEDPNLHGMGTTTTAGVVQGLCLELGHVGDSRCYRLPASGPLEQLTTDHAIVAHLLRLGQITPQEALHHPLRNQLYRAVATAATIEVDATLHILAPTDKVLVCSDGLMLHVADDEIEPILRQSTTPQAACQALVELTLSRGAGDNISVIVLMAG